MSELHILIVEDDEQDIRRCRNAVNRYKKEKDRDINLVECKTLNEALERLDHSFDGAIIDLKLADKGDEGNQVIEEIEKLFFRIPIAIFTGNPGNWNDNLNEKIMLIDVFIKGEIRYYQLLDRFWNIYDTGLTRIMGGRGKIEESLSKIAARSLFFQIDRWIEYSEKYGQDRTEQALLRSTLSHLLQLLDEQQKHCFPEEVYLCSPLLDDITTGSIVKEKTSDQPFVVLSPACDLVPIGENGEFKTERILLVEIDNTNDIVDEVLTKTGIQRINEGSTKRKKTKKQLEELFKNNYAFYYHWLPKTNFFPGGFLNFRKLKTLNKTDFDNEFKTPSIQISPPFVKDIVSRFSSYYARQGQPNIDSKNSVDYYTQQNS